MSSYTKLVTKGERERRAAASKQAAASQGQISPKAIANVSNTVYWSWVNFNANDGSVLKKDEAVERVRKLIVYEPNKIASLIDDTPKSIMNRYALHTMLLIVADKKPSDILAQMSDANILEFQKAISIAQGRAQPNYNVAKRALEDTKNVTMQHSLQVQIDLEQHWDNAALQLNKWSDAFDGFHRVASMANAEKYANEEIWTLDEAAAKFGVKNKVVLSAIKNGIVKKHPDMKEKIENEMFFFVSGKKYFRAKFFGEFQALRGKSNAKSIKAEKKPRDKKQIKILNQDKKQAATPRAKKTKCVSSAEEQELLQEVIGEQPKDLVEVRGLEAKIAAFMREIQNAKANLEKAEAEHVSVMEQITKAEPTQRAGLYDQAIALDMTIISNREKIFEMQKNIEAGNLLIKASRELNAKIANYLAKGM